MNNAAVLMCLVLQLDVAPPPPVAAQCTSDSDCIISTSAGCCGSCCAPGPRARPRKEEEAEQRRCAIMDCAAPRCNGVNCKPTMPADRFTAVCRASQCVSVMVDRSQHCDTNAECTVDYPAMPEGSCRGSVCGCCPPTQPVAITVAEQRKRGVPTPSPAPRPLSQKDGTTQFGLSTGGQTSPPAPQPQCSPCPSREPAQAICSEHHCVLDRPHAL